MRSKFSSPTHFTMQMPAPIPAPSFVSRRRLFEQKLSDLHKCTDLNHLKQMHALIYKTDIHKDLFVAPKLISAFSLCRQMGLAVNVFDQIPNPNAHLCNTLIKAHIRNSEADKALAVFHEMRRSGISPDRYTFHFLLKASYGLEFVKMIHGQVEKCNFYSDLFVPNSMIDAYSRCGLVGVRAARALFDVMWEKDLVSYNTMICGLVKATQLQEARKLFDEMPHRDNVSWNTILDGYAKAGEMASAFELFKKMPSRDVISWSTVIFGYAKIGDTDMAKVLFDSMPEKNMVTWTIMITGYALKGLAKEAILLYIQMEAAKLKLDDGSFISILSACAESGSLGLGKKVHKSITNTRHKCCTAVSNALIDMYCKCGSLNRALLIFKKMETKDLISWNAMIHGLAMHGNGHKALKLFHRMEEEGPEPDKVTFVGVLSACNHTGLVDEGMRYFLRMKNDYKIPPKIEHYGCVIDLLGRGGRLDEAFRVLHEMPYEPNAVIWGSILGACRMHNSVELAEEVLDRLAKLDLADEANFSMVSNIYAAAGDWRSAANARMQTRKREKMSGVSSIELDDKLHEFTVMDTVNPKSEKIYETVNGLNEHLRKSGCVPNLAV